MTYYQQQVQVTYQTDPGYSGTPDSTKVAYVIPHDVTTLLNKGALFILSDASDCTVHAPIAAKIVLDTATNIYYQHPTETTSNMLVYAIKQANQSIYAQAKEHTEYADICATCLMAVIQDETAYLSGMGHSKAYLIRNRQIHEAIASDREDMHRMLGIQSDTHIHITQQPLLPADTVLLCSKGLYDNINDQDIQKLITEAPQSSAHSLVEQAKDKGGIDIAALIIHIPA